MKKKLFSLCVFIIFISCNRNLLVDEKVNQNLKNNFVDLASATKVVKSETSKNDKFSSISKNRIENIQTISGTGGTQFYIFNFIGGGFEIVSADKRIAPILAISDSGKIDFSADKKKNGIGFWLNEQQMAIKNIQNLNIDDKEASEAWDILLGSVPPDDGGENNDPSIASNIYGTKTSTTWGQLEGYNDYTPILNCGSHTPTGCVATAMAQIMKYHGYAPSKNYNWNAMPLNIGSPETAHLMLDIGTAVHMQYGCSESGTQGKTIVPGFKSFGYNNVKAKNISGQLSDPTLDNQLYITSL